MADRPACSLIAEVPERESLDRRSTEDGFIARRFLQCNFCAPVFCDPTEAFIRRGDYCFLFQTYRNGSYRNADATMRPTMTIIRLYFSA